MELVFTWPYLHTYVWEVVWVKKKKGEDKMNATEVKIDRKQMIQASFAKAVKANGKALEKLSKN